MIRVGTRIVPVEVKAGATGRLRSLHMMVAEKNRELAVRVSSEPLQRNFCLLSVPFYLVSEIPRFVAEWGRVKEK